MMANEKKRELQQLPLGKVKENPWNPNTQSDAQFNALCENIKEIGMVEPIMVKPEDDGTYLIVSGAHRYEACKVLGYETVPAYVMDEFDDDAAKFQTVRMNVLRGKIDPVKFTKLYDQMADKYGAELTKTMMGFAEEAAFEELYVNVKKELPKELQDKLDDAKGDIKNIDNLSTILNELFSNYGDTLKQNFMVFTYGGKTHLWVLMEDKLKKKMIDDVVEQLKSGELDINRYFSLLIEKYSDEVLNRLVSDAEFDDDDDEELSLE